MTNIGRGPKKVEWFSRQGGVPMVGIRPMGTPAIAVRKLDVPKLDVPKLDVPTAKTLFTLVDSYMESKRGTCEYRIHVKRVASIRDLCSNAYDFRYDKISEIAVGTTSDEPIFCFKINGDSISEIRRYFPDLTGEMFDNLVSTGISVKAKTEEEAWKNLPGHLAQVVKAL